MVVASARKVAEGHADGPWQPQTIMGTSRKCTARPVCRPNIPLIGMRVLHARVMHGCYIAHRTSLWNYGAIGNYIPIAPLKSAGANTLPAVQEGQYSTAE